MHEHKARCVQGQRLNLRRTPLLLPVMNQTEKSGTSRVSIFLKSLKPANINLKNQFRWMACFTVLSNGASRDTNVSVNRCLFLWQSRLKLWEEWSRMGGDLCNENKTHVTFATRHWGWQKGCSLFGNRRGKKSHQIITYNEDWRRSYTTHTFYISCYASYIRKGSDLLSSAGLWFKIEASWILRALFSRFKKDKDALHTHDVKWNARLSLTTDRTAEESTLCGVSRLKMNYLYNLSSRGVKAMTVVAQWRCTKDIDRTGHWQAAKSLFSPI